MYSRSGSSAGTAIRWYMLPAYAASVALPPELCVPSSPAAGWSLALAPTRTP